MEKWIGHGRRRSLGSIPILGQTFIATGHISSLLRPRVPPDTPPPTPVRPPGHRPRDHSRHASGATASSQQ